MRLLMSGIVVLLAAGCLDAQAGVQRKGDDAKLVRIVGCLGGGPSKFVLTNAVVAEDPGKKDTRAIAASGIVASYDLTARDGVSLAPHVGHKVELTGVVTAAATVDPAAAKGARGAAGKAPTAQFAVTSLKMVSPICLE